MSKVLNILRKRARFRVTTTVRMAGKITTKM